MGELVVVVGGGVVVIIIIIITIITTITTASPTALGSVSRDWCRQAKTCLLPVFGQQ